MGDHPPHLTPPPPARRPPFQTEVVHAHLLLCFRGFEIQAFSQDQRPRSQAPALISKKKDVPGTMRAGTDRWKLTQPWERGATVSCTTRTWSQEWQWLGQVSGWWRSQDGTLDVLTPGPALLGTRILWFAWHLRHFHSGYKRCQPILISAVWSRWKIQQLAQAPLPLPNSTMLTFQDRPLAGHPSQTLL